MRKGVIITLISLIVVALIAVATWAVVSSRDDQQPTEQAPPTTTTDPEKTTDDENTEPATITKPLTLYYVALEDNGQGGQEIGCDDSLIATTTEPVTTDNLLQASIERLISGDDQYIGHSGLYNSLYSSDLSLESSNVSGDTATVTLSGTLSLAGTCDSPRVQAQLEETAMTAAEVSEVTITLNGKPLAEALSQR